MTQNIECPYPIILGITNMGILGVEACHCRNT